MATFTNGDKGELKDLLEKFKEFLKTKTNPKTVVPADGDIELVETLLDVLDQWRFK